MKDVTVALELTLPKSVTDQQIKSFVQDAIAHYLHRQKAVHYEQHPEIPSMSRWSWENEGILGIFEHMIDVVGIVDESLLLARRSNIHLDERWRMLGDSHNSSALPADFATNSGGDRPGFDTPEGSF
jgi:hypothetical protein